LSSTSSPLRGDVWLVNFDPTLGAEIRKTRPAVVVSSDGVGRLPVKLVAPITEWKDAFDESAWLVRLGPDRHNSLRKTSAADVLQLRGIDFQRFVSRIGQLSQEVMEEVAAAIAIVVEYR
jgi:mRNA interferase MazF